MNKILKRIILLLSVVFLFISCKEAPVTERKQLILIPESSEMKLGEDAFRKIEKESELSTNHALVNQVKKVGNRIAMASNSTTYKWEFIVIEDDSTANAFCLPGGKIGIYTGILPYTKDEKGLAAVIGHEVGHAIARAATAKSRDPGREVTVELAALGGGSGLRRVLKRFYAREIGAVPGFFQRRDARRLCSEGLITPGGRRIRMEQTEIERVYRVKHESLKILLGRRLLRAEQDL